MSGGAEMKTIIMTVLLLVLLVACVKTDEQELQRKVDACSAAGMDYTYLKDFKNQPYDVMCVARRVR
jgi:PBP1b-binding outer membrane lipoprotein LpoB